MTSRGARPPSWVRLDHDGLVAELRHPWWVAWLVLWIVPVLLGLGAGIWAWYPTALSVLPSGVEARVAMGFGLLTAVSWLVAFGLFGLVRWWTAPVHLRLRGDQLVVARHFAGRQWARQFDLRHTTVYGAEDHAYLRLIMDDGHGTVEDVVPMPLPLRTGWLARALRGAAHAARRRGAREATEEERAAMARLLADVARVEPQPRT